MANKFQNLADFLKAQAPTCVHKPDGDLPYRFVTPSFGVTAGADDKADVSERSTTGHYLQMYDWDACFFSQVSPRLGLPALAPDVVRNFLALQESDGHIPRTVSPHRIWDKGDQAKPFLCQTLERHLKTAGKADAEQGNDILTDAVLSKLHLYLQYFEKNRRHESGLYHWRNVLESGVDDNLALIYPTEAAKDENTDLGKFPDGEILAVDVSAYMACEFEAFAALADRLGKQELHSEYQKKADGVKQLIEDKLWDKELNMYVGFYPVDKSYVRVRSWTGLTPVCMGIASPERAKLCIENNILSSEHFLRPFGLTSYAASERLYNNSPRGLYGRAMVSNWQGPAWILVSALVCRGLLSYGRSADAKQVAQGVLTSMQMDLEKNKTLHENYDAETGRPLWAPDFMSWNSLAIELVEYMA
jgi:glycogen debranching enzyme